MEVMDISLSFYCSSIESELRNLLHKCSRATGGMKVEPVHLQINGSPVFMKRRIISFGLRESVQKAIDVLVQKGIISAVQSSTWATPIVTPLKRDGKTPRICGDYRVTLNKCLLQKSCATLEAEDILHQFHGSKFYSKLDLKDAYLQIPLDEDSKALTTINTPFGLFRYNFLPFGLSVSPAIFQDVMNQITAGLSGVAVYQDDVVVHASSLELHNERLLALLKRFVEHNVNLNLSKCIFTKSQFTCLGFLVTSQGYKPDPNRFYPLANAPTPSNHTEFRSLMGSLQYYSRFIPNFAHIAEPLFNLLSQEKFNWTDKHENTLRSILSFISSKAVLRTFSPQLHSTLITDASPTGIGAVLEQNGYPVLCISRRLTAAECGYAQTHKEALAVFWAVTRLHKYLFGTHFTIISDHEALKFIYNPNKSLSKSSAAMVQRWSIALSAYSYDIVHKGAKYIQHADYLSRYATTNEESPKDCLLIQPLPISRTDLIRDTKKYFHSVMNSIKSGWSHNIRKRFPEFYKRREELSVTPDGLLCINDRTVIPPTLRSAILKDLHSGHLGIEKMKSLARLTCWWPELNADIARVSKSCSQCLHKQSKRPSNWTPWPMSCSAWQRIHADYCGPFLGKYYALVILDSYSRWPEVYFTTSASSEFTQVALRKTFSREGVPVALVTDNGSHFTSRKLDEWLKSIGCRHLLTAPRHPQSNGLAENFVRILKSAITSSNPQTLAELECTTDNFLMQYRNSAHSTTRDSPAKLFKNRTLRTHMLGVDSAEIIYHRGNDLRPSRGIILNNIGQRMFKILDLDDGSVHRRHVDQVSFDLPDDDIISPNSDPSASESVPDIPTVSPESSEPNQPRRSARLQSKPRLDYSHPDLHLSCGGCSDCN